jgi:hypothetical protein
MLSTCFGQSTTVHVAGAASVKLPPHCCSAGGGNGGGGCDAPGEPPSCSKRRPAAPAGCSCAAAARNASARAARRRRGCIPPARATWPSPRRAASVSLPRSTHARPLPAAHGTRASGSGAPVSARCRAASARSAAPSQPMQQHARANALGYVRCSAADARGGARSGTQGGVRRRRRGHASAAPQPRRELSAAHESTAAQSPALFPPFASHARTWGPQRRAAWSSALLRQFRCGAAS